VPPPAPTEPTPPPDPTAADLYRTAEAALARRDLAGADRALARLVTDMPASPLVDQALYERARIAFSRRAWGEARRHLDALAALGASSLTEPGRYLACRVAVEAHDSSARRCLIEYRATYPKSPHDADARAMLSRLPEDPE
jgi:outer membrane protein assembly factor BamD (BamD/ComL family)